MTEIVTIEEQLGALDRLIEDFRWARSTANPEDQVEKLTFRALKTIERDLRGRQGWQVTKSMTELQTRMDRVQRSRGEQPLGYEQTALISLAQEVVSKWSSIRQALVDFAKQRAREEYLEAEVDLLRMMVHSVAEPRIVEALAAKFPGIAREWESYKPEPNAAGGRNG